MEGADGLIPNVLFAEARNTLKKINAAVRSSSIRPETAPDDPSVLASFKKKKKKVFSPLIRFDDAKGFVFE